MVTVYFSDIVDFTKVTFDCSPSQVVNLLNSLYGMFDSVTEKYDVYKMETVGDSHMIVSGVPQPNGD